MLSRTDIFEHILTEQADCRCIDTGMSANVFIAHEVVIYDELYVVIRIEYKLQR